MGSMLARFLHSETLALKQCCIEVLLLYFFEAFRASGSCPQPSPMTLSSLLSALLRLQHPAGQRLFLSPELTKWHLQRKPSQPCPKVTPRGLAQCTRRPAVFSLCLSLSGVCLEEAAGTQSEHA